jgi:glycosyltransferase involved in cell wall biosynthesis
MTVLLALRRLGPYHHARFQPAALRLPLNVLETRPQSQEYPWQFEPRGQYSIHRLDGHPDPETDPPRQLLDRQLLALLDQLQPRVLISVGWADRAYQRLLRLAQIRRIPAVIISDSRELDEPRQALKEIIKRQLLRGYSSGLVAGQESRAYLEQLGFPAAAIFQPWDVVDNARFAQSEPSSGDRDPHFLCVSRFVAKKNHVGLLQAYAEYQRQGGDWGLRLIGAGPLEYSIRQQIARLPDPKRVQLQPFQQLEDLIDSYARASAFILASSSDQWGLVVNEAMAAGLPCLVSEACGCAPDLIEPGVTGWSFNPEDPPALAPLLRRVQAQTPSERAAMVAAAHQCLQAFSPVRFADGLTAAVEAALGRPRFSRRAALTAYLLSARP